MKIFISSTFQDLETYRAAVLRGLRQMGHEVIAMEDFTAASAPPIQRVLERVGEADAYIGVFAWRYGYVITDETAIPKGVVVPPGFKKGETSITHAEYLEAHKKKLPILAFLLDEATPWPPHLMDAFSVSDQATSGTDHGQKIRELRAQLQTERVVSYFHSPEDLEARVTTAVTVLGMSLQVTTNLFPLTRPVPSPGDSSANESIKDAIQEARSEGHQSITIDIGTEWWSTKLYLLAVLSVRFTAVKRVAVIDDDAFVGLLSVDTIVRNFELTDDYLAEFGRTLRTRPSARDESAELNASIELWQKKRGAKEFEHKVDVTLPNLRVWFGEAMLEKTVFIDDLGAATIVDLLRILDYPSAFVPVETRADTLAALKSNKTRRPRTAKKRAKWHGPPVVVIDKQALRAQLAQKYLDELMDRARLR